MKFSEEQQAAVDVRENCVVSAGAGSGKTAVLSGRFVSLLLDSRAPAEADEILTLTFTNKATGEMRDRIYRRILEKIKDPALSEKDRGRLESARENFSRAAVSTFDSFCRRIVENAAGFLEIPRNFDINNEKVSEIRKNTALDFMADVRPNTALFRMIRRYGLKRVIDEFFEPAAARVPLFEEPNFERRVCLQKEVARGDFLRCCDDLSALCRFLTSEYAAVAKESEKLRTVYRTVRGAAEDLKDGRPREAAQRLAEIDLNGTGGFRGEKREFLNGVKDCRKKAAESALPNSAYIDGIDGQMEASRELDRYVRRVQKEQRENNVFSYSDVVSGALKALKENPGLRQRYKTRFKYIMVDEFQDNNAEQRDLLFLLAEKEDRCVSGIPGKEDLEPEKLFFVGDEKQSVYLFRGADVSVFRMLQEDFPQKELTRNYRSVPGLIEFFNRFFPRVMPQEADRDKPFEAVFKELKYREDGRPHTEIELIRIQKPENGNEDEVLPRETEFLEIAKRIKKLVASEDFLLPGKNGTLRRAEFSDFLILFRNKSEQEKLEKILRGAEIPYNSEKKLNLFKESIAVDFTNLLKTALYPDDQIAQSAFFRSPIAAVSDAALTARLNGKEPDDPRFRAALEKIEIIRSRMETDSLTELFRIFWVDFGYRWFVVKKKENRCYEELAEYFLSYLNLQEKAGRSVVEVVSLLSKLAQDGADDENLFSFGEKTGVSLMSVHASKGLEAPVVILSQTDKGSQNDSGSLYSEYQRKISAEDERKLKEIDPSVHHRLYKWVEFDVPEENFYLSEKRLKKTKISSAEPEQNRAELKRLLYVALTRAESKLLITGKEKKSNTFSEWLDEIFRNETAALKKGGFFTVKTESLPALSETQIRSELNALLSSAAAGTGGDKIENALIGLSREPEPEAADPLVFWRSERAASCENSAETVAEAQPLPPVKVDGFLTEKDAHSRFGTLCHNVLEAALRARDFDLTQTDVASLIKGIFSERKNQIEEEVRRLALNFLQSPFLASHRNAEFLTEKEFLLRREENGREVFFFARVDLLIKEADRVIVVDFKTDSEKKPGYYDRQLELYKEAAESVFGLPAETKLVYLREKI